MEKAKFNHEDSKKSITMTEGLKGQKLLYTDEFKDFIAEKPGYLSYSMKVIDSMLEDNTQSMEVKKIPITVNRVYLGGNSPTFKISLRESDDAFFVKVADLKGNPDNHYLADPTREILTMEYAAKVLEEYDWVQVVDYQCAYVGDDQRTYYVAKWNDTTAQSLEYLNMQSTDEEFGAEARGDAYDKLKKVTEKLSPLGFYDIREGNVAYDPKTGNLCLFDLRVTKDVSPAEKLQEIL